MRKLILFLLLLFTFEAYSQIYVENYNKAILTGSLREQGRYTTVVPWAKVELKGTTGLAYADGRGYFVMDGKDIIITSRDRMILVISAEGYKTLEYLVEPGMLELGVIFMEPYFSDFNPITVNDLMPDRPQISAPMNTIGASALFWDDNALSKATNFQLGMHGYKMRGYDWRNTEVYVNGASFNDVEAGYAYAGLLAGFINISKQNTGSTALVNDKTFYGDVGGYSNVDINPLAMKRRLNVSYAFGNSLYTHSVNASYSTGEMQSGWALSVYLSGRLGKGYVKGTEYEGMSYLFAAAKNFDDEHKFTFFVAGAPTKRGMNNYSTKSIYDSIGNNHFNSAWGYHEGDILNSRKSIYHQPVLNFSHEWEGESSSLTTSLLFTTGNNDETSLNYNNQNSFWNGFTNPFISAQQIEWDSIYNENRNTPASLSKYILDKHSADRTTIVLNSVYDLFDWGNLETTAGIEVKAYFGRYYNEVYDLLGGRNWLNVDKFATPPANPDFYQFDIANPNNLATSDSKIGYDYSINQQQYKLWNMWRYYMGNFKFSLGGAAAYTTYNYKGNVENGKVKESGAKYPNHNFFNFSGKASVAYMFSRQSNIELNAMYAQRAPLFINSYLSPRISGDVIPELTNEKIMAGEVNYRLTGTSFDLRVSGYFTMFNDQAFVRSYYNPTAVSNLNMAVYGLNSRHFGGEASADFRIAKGLKANLAAAYGVYKYTSDPNVIIMQENINDTLITGVPEMNGLFNANTPQMAFSAGAQYEAPLNFWLGLNANFTSQSYSEINPLASTIEQEKLGGAFTLNFNGGYTFVFGSKIKKAISLNVNVQNILDNKKGVLGAYQPFDANDLESRYAYMYGRTMHFMLRFTF